MTLDGVRVLATEIASDLRGASEIDPALGWVLWEGVTLTGESVYKSPYSGFVWWVYKTRIALRADGELVSFEVSEGGTSPNAPGPRGLHIASDAELRYLDARRWEEHRSVEDAPARTMTDVYRSPAEFTDPAGGGITNALRELQATQGLPTALVATTAPNPMSGPPTVRPTTKKKFDLGGCLFGMWLGGFAGAM